MPKFRPDLDRIESYVPGLPTSEVARQLGFDDIVKLASNECPEPPFPEVVAAIAAAAAKANRYPEHSSHDLVSALAHKHDISPQQVIVGAGSSQLLECIALAAGGPGTSAVFANPSFALYAIRTAVAGARSIEVATDDLLRHDLGAMATAIAADTTVIYVCNPNNPTGTHVTPDALDAFMRRVSPEVLIVVDEAYAEYATSPDFATALPYALERDNVVVLRTFSKIYGLAGLRVGYGIGHPPTLEALRKMQAPFSVSSVAQAAALEALNHEDRRRERARRNADQRDRLEAAIAERGLEFAPSQTNFVLIHPGLDASAVADAMLQEGVIVRRLGPWIRVTVGTPEENRRFIDALDAALDAVTSA